MPRNVKRAANISKHLTNGEIKAREIVEKTMSRNEVKISKPSGFSEDKTANYHWNKTIKELKNIELLDNLDADSLARYCKILSRISSLEKELDEFTEKKVDFAVKAAIITRIEAAERMQMTYANKLGLTPESRIRLAKKKTEPANIDLGDDLYGGIEVIDCASGS